MQKGIRPSDEFDGLIQGRHWHANARIVEFLSQSVSHTAAEMNTVMNRIVHHTVIINFEKRLLIWMHPTRRPAGGMTSRTNVNDIQYITVHLF